MIRKYHLMTPGPTEIPPAVLAESILPILHHRTPEFRFILGELSQNLKQIFFTKEDIIILSAGATGGMEACIVNLTDPGETVLTVCGGVFGERWAKIAESLERKVIHIDVPWNEPVNPKEIEQKLKENPEIKLITTTLCETSTGVEHPIKAIAEIANKTEALIVVDAVSGLCACEFKMDEWGIDAVVGSTQKGLMCPPGLSLIALSEKAKHSMKAKKSPKFFWSFEKALECIHTHSLPETPYTPNISLIIELNKAVKMILAEGIEAVWERHQQLMGATRDGIKAMGLKLFVEEGYSPVVTTIHSPDGVKSSDIIKKMRCEWGVALVGGQEKLKEKIFRIGHIGYCDRGDILMTLAILEIVLTSLQVPIHLGAGVRAAQEFFLKQLISDPYA
jgi:aspartate aminotransferase-like enzyme